MLRCIPVRSTAFCQLVEMLLLIAYCCFTLKRWARLVSCPTARPASRSADRSVLHVLHVLLQIHHLHEANGRLIAVVHVGRELRVDSIPATLLRRDENDAVGA